MPIASELERGSYFIYNNEPVRVLRKEVIVVGTHSHSKLKFYIQGLREKGERTVIYHHSDRVDKIEIMRKNGQVISKTGNKVQLMDAVSYETLDSNLPAELINDINVGDTVTFVEVNGKVEILDKR
jgi:translation initiation factor 5A